MTERIAKYLARCGVASRRQAEALIADHQVMLNGQLVDSPATFVTETDLITVSGKEVRPPETPRLWLYHKPAGLVTTHHDPQGRPTVFEQLPKELPRVISVGRLDLNSEGLLLLTNSGALARYLEHPKQGFERRYRVRYRGPLTDNQCQQMRKGLTIDGIAYQGIDVIPEAKTGQNQWAEVILREGKNREIRRIFEHFDHPVSRLIRVAYGSYRLEKLPAGMVKETTHLPRIS